MKTLVVLSALASLAIAAPAQPGGVLEDSDRALWHLQAPSSLPDLLKRERKSPSEISTGILGSEDHNLHHIDAGAPTGRSFAFKKPLIVKKKYGYRLYRDSEEEKAHADSHESCGRQVKVKLCDEDGKSRTTVKGSTQETADIHTSEDDVKHSIKMAKEAVENLQKDLKKMEMKSEMKTAHESQADTELHADIEVARQALKHIHDNFGNLESMSLHATTTRDSEAMHDVHLTIAKTEEERLAQWKEAVENIHKNLEIARNIEDSFKAANEQEDLLHLDHSESAATLHEKEHEQSIEAHSSLTEVNNMRAAKNVDTEDHQVEKEVSDEKLLNKAKNVHLSEPIAREEQHFEDDMNPAPSELIETHLVNTAEQALRSENLEIHEKTAEEKLEEDIENKKLENKENIEHHPEEKNSDLRTDILTSQSEHDKTQLPFMKEVEEGAETKLDMEKKTAFKMTEDIPEAHIDVDASSIDIIDPSNFEAFREHQRSAENPHASLIDVAPLDTFSEQQRSETNDNVEEKNEKLMTPKFVEHASHHDHHDDFKMISHVETLPAMKASEKHLHHLHDGHWTHEHGHLDHLASMKETEDSKKEFDMHGLADEHGVKEHPLNNMRYSHMAEHSHIPSHMGVPHELELASHLHSHRHHHPGHPMTHSGLHEMNAMGSAMHSHIHPSMRDAMEGFGSDHMFRWKPSHESARVAYGSGLSSSVGSSGAVGVFPNANIGGCGIPLLLSCSPSVVSGSLAKAHSAGPSSYSSPAYRTEDDFGFHNKRDIKTANDIRTTNALRTSVVKQKTPIILENKL